MRINNRKGSLRRNRRKDDFSPMDSIANMADCMLVFALGILLSLIISWNVDVSEEGEIGKSYDTKYEVQDISDEAQQEVSNKENLQEMGKVFKDPETGKYYVIGE